MSSTFSLYPLIKIYFCYFYEIILITMQTIRVDIINDKALSLLKDLELLDLIRLYDEEISSPIDYSKYKGAMSKEPVSRINNQLQNLRDGWE